MHTELEEIPAEADQPATKGDLYALENRLAQFVAAQAKETRDHFDVVAENIQQDVAGANKDEISSIKDTLRKHDERIEALEPIR